MRMAQSDHLDAAACDLHWRHGAHANWPLGRKSAVAGRRAFIPPRAGCIVLCANASLRMRRAPVECPPGSLRRDGRPAFLSRALIYL